MNEKVIKYLPIYICWILASTGLIWQVYQVSKMFFTFSTRVDIEMDAPLNLTMPAITICLPLHPNLITLSTLFDVTNLNDSQISEEVTYLPINILSTLETVDVKVFCRTKYPRVSIDSPDGQYCDLFGKTLHRIQYNRKFKIINRCTTYLFQSRSEPPLSVIANEAKDFYALDIYSPGSNILYVYIHNPLEIINLPEADFLIIFTNQSSEIVVTSSRFTVNLPRDSFTSKCADYNEFEFGRMSCVFNCRQLFSQSTCGSWSSEVPAPFDVSLPFRSRGDHDCPRPEEYNCTNFNICPVECKSTWYTTSLVWNHIKDIPSNLTKFYVRRPYGLEFVYNVTPNLATAEYSCYVASCLGIWFGISFSDIMLQIIGKLSNNQINLNENPSKTTIKVNQRRKLNQKIYNYKTSKVKGNNQRFNCFNFKLTSSSSPSPPPPSSVNHQVYQRKAYPPTYLS